MSGRLPFLQQADIEEVKVKSDYCAQSFNYGIISFMDFDNILRNKKSYFNIFEVYNKGIKENENGLIYLFLV